ncbi:MAG: hypothetical protein JJU33_06990 [Phycisphaerales bacterium]|nr:hypothetical protein [Phycisphaerales bacterium]
MRSRIRIAVAALAAACTLGAQGSPWPTHTHHPDRPFEYLENSTYDAKVPTPKSVIGHEVGKYFTRHADIVRYAEALAESSDRVVVERYGQSWQRRPLMTLTISDPANIARLDEIYEANRELADPRTLSADRLDEIAEHNPAIVWLSFNVHGNEASAAEAGIATAYELAASTHPDVKAWLKDVVVVIDPMLNPDGHSRYVSWFENTMGVEPNPSHDAAERREPWPGSRTNHYLFDLNRDWLWLNHAESRNRLPAYRRVLPHLHIDVHEQGWNRPFFFGPGDTPYSANIPQSTKDWLELYGDHNAEIFDKRGLVYSTKERFDYLYPGYGKVLPVYHGAVGLLTEKGGHSFAGLALEFSDHEVLTLEERAHHHFLICMSYVETTAKHREAQIRRFAKYFKEAMDKAAESPLIVLVASDNDPALIAKLHDLCREHGIEIGLLTGYEGRPSLRSFRDNNDAGRQPLRRAPWVISANQPMGFLVRTLFEPETYVEDKDTYDITAWNAIVAFGLEAWYTTDEFNVETMDLPTAGKAMGEFTGEGDVALVIDAAQHKLPSVVGLAAKHDLFLRHAGSSIRVDGKSFEKGSLIIHRVRNRHADLEAFVRDVRAIGVDVHRASTGVTEEGPVLGANANDRLPLPKIALVRNRPASLLSYGQHWWLLDVEQPIPYTAIDHDRLGSVDLNQYNVIVLPDGARPGDADAIRDWVRAGGTLVATGSAAIWAERSVLNIEAVKDPEDLEERKKLHELSFEEREQRGVEDRVPGPVLRAVVDTTHPLSAGLPDWLGVIVRGDRRLGVGENTFVVARFDSEPLLNGLMSERNQKRFAGTPMCAHDRLGRGHVVRFAHDVTIRGFQHRPMRLLLNAIVYGPGL